MRSVLDASAILALMLKESGGVKLLPHVDESVVSTVNLAEVMSRLAYLGAPPAAAAALLKHLRVTVVPFSAGQAATAARLRPGTADAGLSIGDRACIALAQELDVPVVTADRVWLDLDLGVEVVSIR